MEVTKNEEYLELLKNRVDEYMELGLRRSDGEYVRYGALPDHAV